MKKMIGYFLAVLFLLYALLFGLGVFEKKIYVYLFVLISFAMPFIAYWLDNMIHGKMKVVKSLWYGIYILLFYALYFFGLVAITYNKSLLMSIVMIPVSVLYLYLLIGVIAIIVIVIKWIIDHIFRNILENLHPIVSVILILLLGLLVYYLVFYWQGWYNFVDLLFGSSGTGGRPNYSLDLFIIFGVSVTIAAYFLSRSNDDVSKNVVYVYKAIIVLLYIFFAVIPITQVVMN